MFRYIFLSVLVGVFFLGMPVSVQAVACTPENVLADCGANFTCSRSNARSPYRCVSTFTCRDDVDCNTGQVCNTRTNRCEASPDECQPASVVTDCGADHDCLRSGGAGTAYQCVSTLNCLDDIDCGIGQVCNTSNTCEDSPNECRPATVARDCGADQICSRGSSHGSLYTCEDDCNNDNDCSGGQTCSLVGGRSSKICIDPQPTGVSGSPCTDDTECKDEYYCNLPSNGRVGTGMCTLLTNDDAGFAPTRENSVINNYEPIKFSIPSTDELEAGSATSLQDLVGTAIRYIAGLFGSITLIMIIYGGLTMMFAAGKVDRFKQGAKIIVWASIGLISLLLSYLLVAFVLGAIGI